VLQPEKLFSSVVVSPDGSISFPYIGSVMVKGQTLSDVQRTIESKLADGYMKYPIVSVALKESRSRKFFVYGEVMKPGTYYINENVTVLRGITMAGGFRQIRLKQGQGPSGPTRTNPAIQPSGLTSRRSWTATLQRTCFWSRRILLS